MKKAISWLLAIIMVISLLPMSALAAQIPAEGGKIIFSTTFTNDMGVGDTFTVTATLDENPGMAAFTNRLKWNKDVVTLTAFETEYDEDEEEYFLKSDFNYG